MLLALTSIQITLNVCTLSLDESIHVFNNALMLVPVALVITICFCFLNLRFTGQCDQIGSIYKMLPVMSTALKFMNVNIHA